MISKEQLKDWLLQKKGILTAKSARVFRESYLGNDIIAPNSTHEKADERGYVPVELWIMSLVEAENLKRIPGEGLTKVTVAGEETTLAALRDLAGDVLFGTHLSRWPLAKVLDIGGEPVKTSFGTSEPPPIPFHVHGGYVVDGVVRKPGKTEAYFFPPIDIAPYNKKVDSITRIGLKPGVSKADVEAALNEFGTSDRGYTLLNEFPIEPMTGWTVPQGVVHAPGPYLTFEIQYPQDDYHMLSWRLSERLSGSDRDTKYQEHVLRGLPNEQAVIEQVLDWQLTTDPNLRDRYFHQAKVISDDASGRRMQIFFDFFYGEAWEVAPGQTMQIPAKDVPQAGIVWSGDARLNGNTLSQAGENEFFCIPHTSIEIQNTGTDTLYIYTVEPLIG